MKKIIIPILDIIIAIYLVFAMTSFNNPDDITPVCTEVNIDIADKSTYGFLDVDEIKHILVKKHLYPLNKKLKEVSVRSIEEVLISSPFVKTAECSVTKDGRVMIVITQRSPIVRIKNSRGQDYYIDEKGGVMPKSNYTSDLIIATGNISNKYATCYLSVLIQTIMASDLWRNQIEQVNILDDHGVELIPRVGDHIIFLGYLPESNSAAVRKKEIPDYVNKQLTRLEKFYKYGLSKAGWNKYERIDLQFVNQIICRKQGAEMARLQAEKEARELAEKQAQSDVAQPEHPAAQTPQAPEQNQLAKQKQVQQKPAQQKPAQQKPAQQKPAKKP